MNKFIPQYYPQFGVEEAEAVQHYMNRCLTSDGGWLTEHKETERFEEAICKFLNVKYCSVVNNGTISLSIALLACGIKAGDEVIVPDLTMIATANAVKLIGAIPIFADVEEKSLCLDANNISQKITEKTKAIIFVSLNGRAYDLDLLMEYNFHNKLHQRIFIIEDAAQSFGSLYCININTHLGTKFLGTFGDVGSFSFSPHKIITTGQGGALVTDNIKLANEIKQLKNFGRLISCGDIYTGFGINAKFTDLQAVVGIEQLKKVHYRMQRKKEIYNSYHSLLINEITAGLIQMLPLENDGEVPWFVDLYVKGERRADLKNFLQENRIGTREMYPPIHSQKCYGGTGEIYPITQKYSQMGLWLPSSFDLSQDDIVFICNKIKEFFNAK